MGHEEVSGVKVLYQSLQQTPMDYVMLDTQAEFLMKKAQKSETPEMKEERLKMALGCADRGTIAAPSEFNTWARLAQVYVAMEDWENALTILNSCPMFTYQDKDSPLMPEPRDVHLPTLPETRLDEIDSEPDSRYSEQVDPSLLGLRAASYRGTFKKAYSILTEMTSKIGWDQLLKIRSNVFVMEDEYRTEKQEATQAPQPMRSPSMDGLRGTPDPTTNGDEGSEDENEKPSEPATTTLAPNGESSGVEKPSSTVDPDEVKADAENVSLDDISLLQSMSHSCLLTRQGRRVPMLMTISLNLTLSGCVSVGSIACSWFSMKIYGSTQSGARRWLSTAPSRYNTRSRQRSGRFSVRSRNGCSTSTKPPRHTGLACPCASAPRPWPACCASLRKPRARGKRWRQ